MSFIQSRLERAPKSTSALYKNCRLAFPDCLLEGALLTANGKIAAIWVDEPPSHVLRGIWSAERIGIRNYSGDPFGLSFPRKRESSSGANGNGDWIPACAGMT